MGFHIWFSSVYELQNQLEGKGFQKIGPFSIPSTILRRTSDATIAWDTLAGMKTTFTPSVMEERMGTETTFKFQPSDAVSLWISIPNPYLKCNWLRPGTDSVQACFSFWLMADIISSRLFSLNVWYMALINESRPQLFDDSDLLRTSPLKIRGVIPLIWLFAAGKICPRAIQGWFSGHFFTRSKWVIRVRRWVIPRVLLTIYARPSASRAWPMLALIKHTRQYIFITGYLFGICSV